MGEGSFPKGFDTPQYCKCATNLISKSMTVDDAAEASLEMLMNMDNPGKLKGNSKLYFQAVKECVQRFK